MQAARWRGVRICHHSAAASQTNTLSNSRVDPPVTRSGGGGPNPNSDAAAGACQGLTSFLSNSRSSGHDSSSFLTKEYPHDLYSSRAASFLLSTWSHTESWPHLLTAGLSATASVRLGECVRKESSRASICTYANAHAPEGGGWEGEKTE
jgi:hypothetical protein